MRRPARLVLPALAALAALGAAPAPDSASEDPAATDQFTGFMVAANATDLYAPQTTFRIRGWNSSWGQVKLLQLAPDGKEVKQGEVVARFEFIGRDALQWINDRIQRTDAEASQSRITTRQNLEALLMEKRRRELEARQAALDVQREKAISRRQAELFKIRHRIADFEVEAAQARIDGARRAMAAEDAYQDLNVKWMRDDLTRYAFYEKAFQLTAPHDGVVRHAFNAQERRKIQKGDNAGGGAKIVSLARDASLSARFFVPEHRIAEVQPGTLLVVTTNLSAEEHRARVTKVDFFPQELGFLMENPNLPNGQEKAFAVTAELEGSPDGLSAGTEIRVKVRAP